MGKYSEFEIRTQPWFDQFNFKGFNQAIPMKTLVIYCFDPRAADVPQAVAAHFGDEVYPGENILDEAGNRVGSTQTLFTLTNGVRPCFLRVNVGSGNGLPIQRSKCGCGSPLVLWH
jgi:carbonic anhydrase